MDPVLRALSMYFFLFFVFRLVGRRTISEVTTFDFVLLLVIGEATQQALLGSDYSITNALIVIVTLIGMDLGLSIWKQYSPRLDRLIEGVPIVLVNNGEPIREHMNKERVSENDVLYAARRDHGLERMDQIKYAILERNGAISVIPKEH